MSRFFYEITSGEQKALFIKAYFLKPLLWFQRILFGPLLLAAGVHLLASYKEDMMVGILFILTGVYYISRPFIFLTRMKFSGTKTVLHIDESGLEIIDENGKTIIKKADIKQTKLRMGLFFIKVQINMNQWLVYELAKIRKNQEQLVREIKQLIK